MRESTVLGYNIRNGLLPIRVLHNRDISRLELQHLLPAAIQRPARQPLSVRVQPHDERDELRAEDLDKGHLLGSELAAGGGPEQEGVIGGVRHAGRGWRSRRRLREEIGVDGRLGVVRPDGAEGVPPRGLEVRVAEEGGGAFVLQGIERIRSVCGAVRRAIRRVRGVEVVDSR